MENTYILEKQNAPRRVAANIAWRFVTVAGFIGLLILPGGIEQGKFGLWGFILLELLMMALIGAGILGETATHVDMPLDGGEEDE